MPNWCSNSTKIEGNKQMVLDCLSAIGNGDTDSEGCLDFEKIIPMPKGLKGTGKPTTTFRTRKEVEEYNSSKSEHANEAITEAQSRSLKKKFGADNWYDWSCKVWGTKWNVSETFALTYTLKNDGANTYGVRIDYATAWCPAYGILQRLQEDWPELKIRTKWSEEGMDCMGLIRLNPDGTEHPDSYEKSMDDW
jgi:hypothetical protein